MVIKEKILKQELNSLEKSEVFKSSSLYFELLKYLVDSTLKGEVPKEVTIAHEFFKKNVDTDKDINIRPYISNLRKKLKLYYEEEGRKNRYQIVVNKGHYTVGLEENSNKTFSIPTKVVLTVLVALVLVVVAILSIKKGAENKLWSDFYNNEKETLFVLGDHYFFHSRIETGDWVTCRNISVNSDKELDEFLEGKEHEHTKKSSMEYLNPQTAYGLFHILPQFARKNVPINLKMASDLQVDMLKNRNFVFIGSYKTLAVLKSVVKKLGVEFLGSSLSFKVNDTVKEFQFRRNYPSVDHISLIRFRSNSGVEVLFILSNNDFGNIGMAKAISTPEKLVEIENNLSYDNFRALFEVTGVDKTDFNYKMVSEQELNDELQAWP